MKRMMAVLVILFIFVDIHPVNGYEQRAKSKAIINNPYENSQVEKNVLSFMNRPVKNSILNESMNTLSSDWFREMPSIIYSGLISYKYPENGIPAFRFELRRNDFDSYCGGKRSDICKVTPESPLEEHTYYFDIMLPEGGNEDYEIDPKSSEILVQWHNEPDVGEGWTMPPLSLHTRNGHYYLYRIWDDAEITTDAELIRKGHVHEYDLGSYINDKGIYVKWAFHVKWGWLESQDPMLEVYKNGIKILDLDGLPNTMNDQKGVRQQLGIYKNDWDNNPNNSLVDRRVVYFNNVNVK
jgi:hypothetical protein